MKKSLLFFLLISSVIYLQTNFLDQLAFHGVKPDIALILLVYISIRNGAAKGTAAGFLSGLLEDVLSLSPLGFHSFIKTIIAYLSSLLGDYISVESKLFHIITVAVLTLIKFLLAAMLIAIFSIEKSGNPLISTSFLIEMLYNAILAPLCFIFFNWIVSRFRRK